MKMVQLKKKNGSMNIKAIEYVNEWVKLLKDIKPSEKGFSERSIREDRESH